MQFLDYGEMALSAYTLLLGCGALLLLFTVCYVLGGCVAAPRNSAPGLGIGLCMLITGLCGVSFLFLLTKIVGSVALVILVTLSSVALTYRCRRPRLAVSSEYSVTQLLSATAVIAVAMMPTIIMGLQMGTGDFPPVFFAADSPYFLHQVHALMTTTQYPPPSFEVVDHITPYHYGIQSFVALASLVTGLKPHFVMFAVIVPFLEIVTGLLIYDICRRALDTHRRAVLALALVLFGSHQYLVNYLDPSIVEFIIRPENYNFRYSHPPSVIGWLMALCIVRALLDFEHRSSRRIALLLVACMPLFRIPYVIPVGAGLSLCYLYELHRRWSDERVYELLAASVLSVGCLVAFGSSGEVARAAVRFDLFGFMSLMSGDHKQTMLVFVAIVAITVVLTKETAPGRPLVTVGLFAGSSFLLFLGLGIQSSVAMDQDLHLVFDLVVRFSVLGMSAYLIRAWFGPEAIGTWSRGLAAVALVGLLGPGLLSHLHHIHVVIVEPNGGHEYVDNRIVADALDQIPLDGTLIATNDLRYPADDFRRSNRQFQLAGIFGHRNLASNLSYRVFSGDRLEMLEAANQLFQRAVWPVAEIAQLRDNVGLTHVLIHKHYPHSQDIPLRMIYENRDYAVYLF